MQSFEQHPDGRVIIRMDGLEYMDTEANFAADAGMAAPTLPEPYRGRIYEPGTRHFLSTHNRQDPQPLDWPEGAAAIAAFADIVAAKDARENPPPTLAELKVLRIGDVKQAGFARVEQDYPPHAQRRLAFAVDTDAERKACRDLILAVKAEGDRVEAQILAATSKAKIETAFATLNLPA